MAYTLETEMPITDLWYRNCTGRTIGRILHFMYWYCGFDVMEHCTIGTEKDKEIVLMYGEKIATIIEWEADIPTFEFHTTKMYNSRAADYWAENQCRFKMKAILDTGY